MESLNILAIAFVAMCASFLLIMKLKKKQSHDYCLKETLFSRVERSFFIILKQAASDRYEIFAKVRIADILTPQKGLNRKSWQMAFAKIANKHFDYVLCNKDTLEIVAVIELDDKSHEKASVIDRDFFIKTICINAGLSFIRFHAKESYQIQAIQDKIADALKLSETVSEMSARHIHNESTYASSITPKRKLTLVLKIQKRMKSKNRKLMDIGREERNLISAATYPVVHPSLRMTIHHPAR